MYKEFQIGSDMYWNWIKYIRELVNACVMGLVSGIYVGVSQQWTRWS